MCDQKLQGKPQRTSCCAAIVRGLLQDYIGGELLEGILARKLQFRLTSTFVEPCGQPNAIQHDTRCSQQTVVRNAVCAAIQNPTETCLQPTVEKTKVGENQVYYTNVVFIKHLLRWSYISYSIVFA